MVFLDKFNWPVVTIKGRPITNLIRLLIHTRKIKPGYWDGYQIQRKGFEVPGVCDVDNSVTSHNQ